ncbi:unnamed protein product [Parnassius apollo]|uniref:(apollo) hypothetical protein n=1 Tax=Parnassius apollo TaxID=110799 RepID=A0A8S3X4N2_PARAO|nr:unnamed protein product [Parnassius apollo]
MQEQNTQAPNFNVQRKNTEEQNVQEQITTEQNTQTLNAQGQDKKIIDHPTGQGNNEQSFSTVYATPHKSVITNSPVSYHSTSTTLPKDWVIPSPLKGVLFWPKPGTKKRRIKELVPSAITSET